MYLSWLKNGSINLNALSTLKFRRSNFIGLVYYPALFFTGIGLSLGKPIAQWGVAIHELLLIFVIFLFIFVSPLGVAAFKNFYIKNQIKFSIIICLLFFSAAGYLTGSVYDPDFTAVFQTIRLFLFSFLVFAIPYVALVCKVSNPKNDLAILTFGVVTSIVINLVIYKDSPAISLPGQNMIGIYVALLMPFLIYLLFIYKENWKKVLVLVLMTLFLATSLLSWSKGSWLGIILGCLFFFFAAGRRGLLAGIFITVILLIFSAFFIEEIMKIYDTELSASTGSNSNFQRYAIFLSGFYIALDNPFGVGSAYEYFAASYVKELEMFWVPPDPHNTLAHVAALGGIGACFSFVMINVLSLYSVLSVRSQDRMLKTCLTTIFVVGFFLMQLSGIFFTQAFWWLFLGIFCAYRESDFVKQTITR